MKPRYGYGFFSIDLTGEFRQKILFFYWDPDEELYRSVSNPSGRKLELEAMKNNMQSFLDSERILINGGEVRAKVVYADIGFLSSVKRPYVEFLITFRGSFMRGVNRYENYYERERVEYDYRVVWVFPEGFKVLRAELGFPYNLVDDRIVVLDLKKGSEVPGYELIEFLAP